MQTGFLLTAGSTFGLAFTPDFWVLFVTRLLQGLGTTLFITSGKMQINEPYQSFWLEIKLS